MKIGRKHILLRKKEIETNLPISLDVTTEELLHI